MTDYSKMSDFDISKRVLIALGYKQVDEHATCAVFMSDKDRRDVGVGASKKFHFDPCNNPSDAWPIIIWSMISLCANRMPNGDEKWFAMGPGEIYMQAAHKNPLRAAMIVFLMMKEDRDV